MMSSFYFFIIHFGMAVRIIITGGTIDDLEYDSPQLAPENHHSLIPSMLEQARNTLEIHVEELMQRDSRFVTSEDRALIAKRCRECSEDQIVITHGTMTLPDTALYLSKEKIPKIIVLVGSMVPANREDTDAYFNLGAGIIAVQLLSPGVWVTMNGRIFSGDNVKKNHEKGIFETL